MFLEIQALLSFLLDKQHHQFLFTLLNPSLSSSSTWHHLHFKTDPAGW